MSLALRVTAYVLEVVQERGDRRGVEHAEVDLVRRDTGGGREVLDEQPPGVAVGRDRVRGQALAGVGVVGEVGLQGWREECHDRSCGWSSLAAARAISSGVADRYQ